MHRLIPDGYRDCSNYGTSWCINKATSSYDHQDSVSLCVFFLMQSHIPVLWRTKWEREVAFRIQSLWLWDQGHGMLKSYLTFFKGYLIICFPCCSILVVVLLLLLLLLLHFRCVFISHHQTSLKPQQTVVFSFWQKVMTNTPHTHVPNKRWAVEHSGKTSSKIFYVLIRGLES